MSSIREMVAALKQARIGFGMDMAALKRQVHGLLDAMVTKLEDQDKRLAKLENEWKPVPPKSGGGAG